MIKAIRIPTCNDDHRVHMVLDRRRYFTLLELLVVMAILAVTGGAVAIGVRRALEDQRFRSEVGVIVNKLRLAQDLMLIIGTDVHVKFAQDNKAGGNRVTMEMETRLPPEIEREVLREHGHLKMIRGIFFRDLNTPQYAEGQIDVRFFSSGAVMSRGVMRLATSDREDPPAGTLEAYVCLPGYPSPISSTDQKVDSDRECNKKAEELYDSKLTQDTLAKLPESLKQTEEPKEEEEDKKGNDSQNPDSKKNPNSGQSAKLGASTASSSG